MVMNLYILILISLPEATLNLYVFLHLAGKNFKLNIKDRKSVSQFLLALALMLCSSLIIRPLVPNMLISIIFHSLAYTLILARVYKIALSKSMLYVSLVIMFYSAVENLYLPFIIVYVSKGLDNFNKYYQLFVFYSLPYRLAQIALIVFLNKYGIVFEITKINKAFNKIFITFLYTITFLEYCFASLFYVYFDKMTLFHQIVFSLSISIMVLMSTILVFEFINISIKGILTGGYKQYQALEEGTRIAFNKVYSLLKNHDSESATTYMESLLEVDTDKNAGGDIHE